MQRPTKQYDEANAVHLTGNELGDGLSFNKLWDKAKQYAKDHFSGKDDAGKDREFPITSNGHRVRIPVKGIKHTLEFAKTKDDIYAVIALPQLLERAYWDKNAESHKKRTNIDHVEIYYASLKIGNNNYVAEMVVFVEKGGKEKMELSSLRSFHHQKIEGPEDQ